MNKKFKAISKVLSEAEDTTDNNIDRSTQPNEVEVVSPYGDGLIRKHYPKQEIEKLIKKIDQYRDAAGFLDRDGKSAGKPTERKTTIQKLKP